MDDEQTNPFSGEYREEFFAGYVECALWSSNDESDDSGGRPLDENYGADDIAPDSLASMRQDCDDFIESNKWSLLYEGSAGQHGHDFWLTRNHHGTGFWDRGYGRRGDELTKAAHVYGESNLYIGDDEKIYAY